MCTMKQKNETNTRCTYFLQNDAARNENAIKISILKLNELHFRMSSLQNMWFKQQLVYNGCAR